nr:hypothetical protein [Tanacetum cinerariifolium]
MVLRIALATIIDRQLPFEYTITSRSTDVVVMAQPVQNINHSAFRSMFEREKLSGNNFNDWFRQLKLVLRLEKKMYIIEQPLPAAPAADYEANVLAEWNALYDAYNEVACLMLGSMTLELHRQFENYSPYEMLQELKSMFEKQAGVKRHVSRQGASYFITFTNDYSHYGYVYLLKHKHEENRTLLDIVRSMMNLTTPPLSFWDYALESATRILNMVPTKKVDKTPYELLYGKVPNLSYLKVWGCEVLLKRDTPDKLQQRSVKCIFIGYPKKTIGYYFYFPHENKIVVARYAEFFVKNLITQEVSGRTIDLKEIQDEDTSPSEITRKIPMVEGFEPPQEEVISIRRSERTHRASNRLCLNVEVKEHSLGVNTAFLNGYLDKNIYMVQPKGFVDPNHPRKNPGECHWTAVKNILKYLRNTKDMFLVYGRNPKAELRVDCYCDAVDWKSSKQSTTAMSATEAEYIAALEAAMEAVWIRKFISGLGIVPTINEPIRMFCDNSAALHLANEPGVQRGARHYHRRYHYVSESIALGKIRFLKVQTDDNLADPFTKALSKGNLTQHARSMGLRLASSFM